MENGKVGKTGKFELKNMTIPTKSYNSPYDLRDLQALKSKAGAKITSAIQQASARTGVDFSYLMQQAQVESSFRTHAKASTSSATGLYQFIDSTWIGMVRDHGEKYGLSRYANQIDDRGRVSSPSMRQEILALRKDPQIASLMAGEYAAQNKNHLEKTVGGDIGSTELYMAHFMGPGGAAEFLSALQKNPSAKAAHLFPDQARSNKNIFYHDNGRSKTLSEIYAHFDNKFSIEQNRNQIPNEAYASVNQADAPVWGRVNVFDEAKGTWSQSSNPEDIRLAVQMAKQQNITMSGMVEAVLAAPKTGSYMRNPLDILQLAELKLPSFSSDGDEHSQQSRYNS
jgi:hypothetical protein